MTIEAENICDMTTAKITFINDFMSNDKSNLTISTRLKAFKNYPLFKYLFSNPPIKHK